MLLLLGLGWKKGDNTFLMWGYFLDFQKIQKRKKIVYPYANPWVNPLTATELKNPSLNLQQFTLVL